MSRILEFDVVSDSRLGGSEEKLVEMVAQIKSDLRKAGCAVDEGQVETYSFTKGADGNPLPKHDQCTSWRCRFLVLKNRPAGRGLTWNYVKFVINKTYAPHYRFV